MMGRLYFFISLIFISLLGYYVDFSSVPNQELIIGFSDSDAKSSTTQKVITVIKQELKKKGATKIAISPSKDGLLTIRYRSISSATTIEQDIVKSLAIKLQLKTKKQSPKKIPVFEENTEYALQINELNLSFSVSYFLITSIFSIENKTQDFPNVLSCGLISNPILSKPFLSFKVKTSYHSIDIASCHTLPLPEVRAGPRLT